MMTVGGFRIRKSLMIDFGSFTASDFLIIAIDFCKLTKFGLWEDGFLKKTVVENSWRQC